jgi:hypothetical protein
MYLEGFCSGACGSPQYRSVEETAFLPDLNFKEV